MYSYESTTSTILPFPYSLVPTLNHEVLDDAMEWTAAVAAMYSIKRSTIRSQLLEISRRFWHNLAEETNFNAASRFAPDGDVKVDCACYFWILGLSTHCTLLDIQTPDK